MSHLVNSNALDEVMESLGLHGGNPETFFHDEDLFQMMDVAPQVRRARTGAGTTGLYTVVLSAIHPGADQINVVFDPYSAGETGSVGQYPAIVPPGFDVWLLDTMTTATTVAVAGSHVLTIGANLSGFGIDNLGAAVSISNSMVVAGWGGLDTFASWIVGVGLGGSTTIYTRVGKRIGRQNDVSAPGLKFWSLSAAAGTIKCVCELGIFPSGMGQDGLV